MGTLVKNEGQSCIYLFLFFKVTMHILPDMRLTFECVQLLWHGKQGNLW